MADGEALNRVVGCIGLFEPPAAVRDGADAAPIAVTFLKDFVDDTHRTGVAFFDHDALISILDLGAALFQLADRPVDTSY